MDSVNLAQKLRSFHDLWSPKIVGELNDHYVKLVKLRVSSCGTITMRRTSSS